MLLMGKLPISMAIYPLVMTNIAIEHGPVEIVDLPSYKMAIRIHIHN